MEGDLGLGIVSGHRYTLDGRVEATHLAVVCCSIDVKDDQEKYHVDESGQACNRIDLPKGGR